MPNAKMPAKAARQWEHVYQSERARGLSESRSAAAAWSTVKRSGYVKCGTRWVKTAQCVRGRIVR